MSLPHVGDWKPAQLCTSGSVFFDSLSTRSAKSSMTLGKDFMAFTKSPEFALLIDSLSAGSRPQSLHRPQPSVTFTGLPLEIRDEIYKGVLVYPNYIAPYVDPYASQSRHPPVRVPVLLQKLPHASEFQRFRLSGVISRQTVFQHLFCVSKQVSEEAITVYYRCNKFFFNDQFEFVDFATRIRCFNTPISCRILQSISTIAINFSELSSSNAIDILKRGFP
ncbi:MAG: hypothetical protein Q9180_009207, partial [Flavoplaca navasiana]